MSRSSQDPQPSQPLRNLPVPAAQDVQERQNVEMLTSLMGSNSDSDIEAARRILRKYNGDLNKAATALLEGDRAEEISQPVPAYSFNTTPAPDYDVRPPPGTPTGSQTTREVIDLTSEDHELRRALQLSLEQNTEPKFGPSNRPADGSWAMVPATVASDTAQANTSSGISYDDQSLNRAIEASYNDFANANEEDELEAIPTDGRAIRKDHRPVALRSTSPSIAYAILLLHGLFNVPQIRQIVCQLDFIDPEEGLRPEDSGMWNLIEIFAHMDKGVLAILVGDDLLRGFDPKPCSSPSDLPGPATADFFRKIAEIIEVYVRKYVPQIADQPPLFHLTHGRYDCIAGSAPALVGSSSSTCAVNLEIKNTLESRELLVHLANELNYFETEKSVHNVILEPSQVIVFNISASAPSQSGSPEGLIYPNSVYLDQFLEQNLELANSKRLQQRTMKERINQFTQQKQALSNPEGVDTLQAVRSSLYYYEHIADAKGDAAREDTIKQMAAKLKAALNAIEKQLESIDRDVQQLRMEETLVMDCPELQKHKYDLRAVFMHTGIPGRKQIYSYVKDRGSWWKTVDMVVTEVPEETVFTDPAGLHLGAGPYMLIYSRSIDDENPELTWPDVINDHMNENNEQFLSDMEPDVAAQLAPFLQKLRSQTQAEESPADMMSQ